jgi:hypothetical protein
MEFLNPKLTTVGVKVSREGRTYYSKVSYEKALIMVEEEAAVVISASSILKLFHRTIFIPFIFERDHRVCRYCHLAANTIDHIKPRSSGGISSPKNCIAACSECNGLKKSMDMERFVKKYKKFHPFHDWDLSVILSKVM